jgi:glycosyltransferase involved in cell wall biosynthesis
MAVDNNIEQYVDFISWIDRNDLMQMMKTSSAFLFPSHEGAGMVVAEALSFGLPVICLDNEGPGEFIDASCGFAIPMKSYEQSVQDLNQAVSKMFHDKDLRNAMRVQARKRFETHFNWEVRGEQLNAIYQSI